MDFKLKIIHLPQNTIKFITNLFELFVLQILIYAHTFIFLNYKHQ